MFNWFYTILDAIMGHYKKWFSHARPIMQTSWIFTPNGHMHCPKWGAGWPSSYENVWIIIGGRFKWSACEIMSQPTKIYLSHILILFSVHFPPPLPTLSLSLSDSHACYTHHSAADPRKSSEGSSDISAMRRSGGAAHLGDEKEEQLGPGGGLGGGASCVAGRPNCGARAMTAWRTSGGSGDGEACGRRIQPQEWWLHWRNLLPLSLVHRRRQRRERCGSGGSTLHRCRPQVDLIAASHCPPSPMPTLVPCFDFFPKTLAKDATEETSNIGMPLPPSLASFFFKKKLWWLECINFWCEF